LYGLPKFSVYTKDIPLYTQYLLSKMLSNSLVLHDSAEVTLGRKQFSRFNEMVEDVARIGRWKIYTKFGRKTWRKEHLEDL